MIGEKRRFVWKPGDLELLIKKFDPDQLRDDFGRWEGTGAGGKGRGVLHDAAGNVVAEIPEHLKHIAIPPAWKDVQVNLNPNGDLLVKGIDSKGRVQSIYSDTHKAQQAVAKYERVKQLATIDDKVGQALKQDKSEEGAVLRLIRETGIRPGGEGDTGAEKQAYGATTLLGKHVITKGDETRLRFVGKKGVKLDIPVRDGDVARIVRERAELAGSKGRLFNTDSGRLVQFTNRITGGDYTPKDFRTLKATRMALWFVERMTTPKTEKEFKKAVKLVAIDVSKALGNTPTVALQSYINPMAFAKWRKAI